MQIKLSEIPTKAPKELEKDFIKAKTAEILNDIKKLQDILIASKKNALLVILQGMDASGKDGVTKNVFGALNPLGINVAAFKKPTEEEMAHDFLWRVHKVVPSKGNITIFNRSHYEDVLIQRVHHWVDEKTIKNRFEAINDFETLLEQTGTKIIKCFLHISENEQLERLQERKTNPEKMWKHNDDDWEERKLWKQYQNAYEDVFENCSKAVKWHIIQTDQNWYKEYLIADLVKNALEDMHLEYPLLNSK
ncbi:MAG: polyphosphate kinase [Bacteroidetes bacterium]|nr:polyphosphate kinase [Bacteroidota bacterium]